MADPVTQWQIVASDPDAVASFYKRLFDWTITTNNALAYREVDTGGMNGGIWPAPPTVPSFAQLFVEVEDVNEKVTHALALGASTIVPVTTLPDGDVMTILRDPTGLSFGIVQRNR